MFYVSLMATTKQKPTVGIQTIKSRESKHTTMKDHQFTKEDGKKGRMEKGNFKTTRKQLIRWY